MARSTSASTTSATPTEIFSDLMSKFMIHSPSSDLTWKQKDTPAEYSFDATSFASQQGAIWDWWKDYLKLGKPLARASNEEIIKSFHENVWLKINACYHRREKRIQVVPEEERNAFLAKVNSMRCDIDAFWDVKSIDEEETAQDPKNKWLVSAEQMMMSYLNTMRRRPDLCTNCLGEHKLKTCPNIHEDASQNLAAWYDPTFAKVTGKTPPRLARENLKKVKKWEQSKLLSEQ